MNPLSSLNFLRTSWSIFDALNLKSISSLVEISIHYRFATPLSSPSPNLGLLNECQEAVKFTEYSCFFANIQWLCNLQLIALIATTKVCEVALHPNSSFSYSYQLLWSTANICVGLSAVLNLR